MPSTRLTLRTILLLLAAAAVGALAAGFAYRTYRANHAARAVPPPADPGTALARQAFPGWDIDPWGQASLRTASTGIVLETNEGHPGGLFFKRSLNPGTLYRLRVRGHAQHNVPALRLQLDGGPQRYYSLASGDLNMVLPRSARIEALVYHDEPYSFTLSAISIDPCPGCLTDADLKASIVKDARVSPADAPIEMARKLRNWTADAVVLGGEPVNMQVTLDAVGALPVSQTYTDIFKPGLGGVSCAGFAVFYQKVLALFSIPSFTADIGYDDGTMLTHVTTIVVVGSPDRRRFYILDPTFSGEYVADGQLVDAIDLLKGKKAEFQTAPMSRRVLIPHNELARFLKDNETAQSHAICDKESAIAGTTECRGFSDNVAYNGIMMGSAMARTGFRPGQDFILGLMKHAVLGVLPSDLDPNAHLEFLKQVAKMGIRIPKAYRAG